MMNIQIKLNVEHNLLKDSLVDPFPWIPTHFLSEAPLKEYYVLSNSQNFV